MKNLITNLCVLLASAGLAAAAAKPNVLHIHADDHRADGLGALGTPMLKTPHLDTLVERGTVEDDARAPLIVSAPRMKTAGQQTDALVEFIDIYPTLADLAGLPAPAKAEGKSFRALLDDPKQPFKQPPFPNTRAP